MDNKTALELIEAVNDALRCLAGHDHNDTECGGEVSGVLSCEGELKRIGARLDAIKAKVKAGGLV